MTRFATAARWVLVFGLALIAFGCGSSDSGAPEVIVDGDAESEASDTPDGDLDTKENEDVPDADTSDSETALDGDTSEPEAEAEAEADSEPEADVEAEVDAEPEAELEPEGDTEETPCVVYYRDDDEDGFGQSDDSKCLERTAAPYTATGGGDCNDADRTIHPEAPELCDTKDNDCDDSTDNDVPDMDKDCASGYVGVCAAGKTHCEGGTIVCTAVITPGSQSELCDNLDNDCDGVIDEGMSCTKNYFDSL